MASLDSIRLDGQHRQAARRFLEVNDLEPRPPEISFLERITRAFAAIPYENITKILRYHEHASWRDRLRMPEDVVEDNIAYQAGGTCFSLAYCLERILSHLGFEARIAMADMPFGADLHCALLVEVSTARYLVDPGYLLPRPIPIPGHGDFMAEGGAYAVRLQRSGDLISLSTIGQGAEKHRYCLKSSPVGPDVFLNHWIRSFEMPTLNGILVTALKDSTHLYLHNNHFRATSGERIRKETVRQGYGERIEEVFGIRGTLVERARDILQATGRSRIKGPTST